jgi:hypothetical protein
MSNMKPESAAPVENDDRPAFLITIDTEGDNLWANKTTTITTTNSRFLPRFQSLCDSYGLKPTYLTNFEMATSKNFQEFGLEVLKRNVGEIGMHLHAWNTPPLIPLTENDYAYHPYLIEYPTNVMREKIAFMTRLLQDSFDVTIISHRAGRWSFNATYARLLVEYGYRVDCSVTPHVSWRSNLGDPSKKGGTDFSHFPENAYFVDLNDISRPGDSLLLEIPVTILPGAVGGMLSLPSKIPMVLRALNYFSPAHWLRPTGKNLKHLLNIVRDAVQHKYPSVEFMLHSSELMPGGSPNFATADDIDRLYSDLKALFEYISGEFSAATLKEYYQWALSEEKERV